MNLYIRIYDLIRDLLTRTCARSRKNLIEDFTRIFSRHRRRLRSFQVALPCGGGLSEGWRRRAPVGWRWGRWARATGKAIDLCQHPPHARTGPACLPHTHAAPWSPIWNGWNPGRWRRYCNGWPPPNPQSRRRLDQTAQPAPGSPRSNGAARPSPNHGAPKHLRWGAAGVHLWPRSGCGRQRRPCCCRSAAVARAASLRWLLAQGREGKERYTLTRAHSLLLVVVAPSSHKAPSHINRTFEHVLGVNGQQRWNKSYSYITCKMVCQNPPIVDWC